MAIGIIVLVLLVCAVVPFYATKAYGVEKQVPDYYGLEKEIPTIYVAAERNRCTGKLYSILLAIRKAEGTFTFGIKHPACQDMVKNDPNNAADIYASFAAKTVRNNFERWKDKGYVIDGIEGFIIFLSNKYCPPSIDPQGNKNWRKNVLYYFKKFEAAK